MCDNGFRAMGINHFYDDKKRFVYIYLSGIYKTNLFSYKKRDVKLTNCSTALPSFLYNGLKKIHISCDMLE